MVYYKMVNAFDHVNVPIQQAVISTIGHQVIDTFYILPSDHKKNCWIRFWGNHSNKDLGVLQNLKLLHSSG
ncbi:MAG: hypothetical protein CM1200mP28_03330 [Deltaproteobacteria bacterium]|nr:MAG: hypothetical protein CM1200mP28_03330 [Deltaproteobacteria bacterium]